MSIKLSGNAEINNKNLVKRNAKYGEEKQIPTVVAQVWK